MEDNMRVYINSVNENEVRELGVALRKHGELCFGDVSAVSSLYFETSDTGIFGNDPKVPVEFISGATIESHVDDGFIKPGTYEHENSTAEINTYTAKVGEPFHEELNVRQVISIVSSSIEGARTLLSLLRQGKVEPKEEWKGHASQYRYLCIEPPANSSTTNA